tara:strand:- start:724 stop:879 length:156 start_codon:yes stop_codon:yes gene_type:complete
MNKKRGVERFPLLISRYLSALMTAKAEPVYRLTLKSRNQHFNNLQIGEKYE